MWGPLLFAIGMTAAGFHLWRLAWRYLGLRRAMRGWPRVPAQILGYRTRRGARSSRVDVKVRYQYNGRALEVWSTSPTRSAYGKGDVQAERQVAARFPRGTSHQVFVNPTTPEEAFLQLPEPVALAMLVGGGVLLVAFAMASVSPTLFRFDQEAVTLAFMVIVGVVLATIAVFAAIALWRLPRP